MRLLIIILTFWFGACGHLPAAEQPAPYVDEGLRPYLLLFSDAGQVYTGHIIARFDTIKQDDGKHILAYCYYATATIVVDSESWIDLNIVQREVLMFHELGHCVLGRIKHIDTMRDNKCQTSMMHSRLMSYKCYLKDRDYYINELFNGY